MFVQSTVYLYAKFRWGLNNFLTVLKLRLTSDKHPDHAGQFYGFANFLLFFLMKCIYIIYACFNYVHNQLQSSLILFVCHFLSFFLSPFSPYALHNSKKHYDLIYCTVYLSSVHQLIRNRFPIGGKNLYKNYKNIAGRKRMKYPV